MTFDPTSVEVTCVTLPKDHCVQVPREYINVCGYSDQFCKLPRTYTYYILHTYYVHTTNIRRTYYVQNQWSHSLFLNYVQVRQSLFLNYVQVRQSLFLNYVHARQQKIGCFIHFSIFYNPFPTACFPHSFVQDGIQMSMDKITYQ